MAVPATTASILYGVLSDFGLASSVLTDAQLEDLAATPPPVSLRDVGWYRAAHKLLASLKSERQVAFPVERHTLATGEASQIVPAGPLAGTRFQVRIESFEAGRPWSLLSARLGVHYEDGFGAGDARIVELPSFEGGVDRGRPPGKIALTSFANARNVSYQGGYPRSRRGFSPINQSSTTVSGKPSATYDATNAAGETWHLAMIGGTLYSIDNGILTSLDTGWPQDELPTVATVGLKTFIATRSRLRVFQQGTVYTPGIAAPTDKPVFVSSTPNVSGGVVALTPGYEYLYTFYDGTRLTESGPSDVTPLTLPAGTTPSSLLLSVGVSASSTVSARRIYRRKAGTETWYRVGSIEDNTTTSFTDSSEVPLDEILESPGGFYVTSVMPSGSAVAEVEGRLLLWRDEDDSRRVWISEVGDGERWHPFNGITTGGEMRAVVAHEGRAILFTDRTVEVVEGDWVRGSAGTLGVQRRLLERARGVFGPFAACETPFGVLYADPGGIHRLQQGFVAKDASVTISDAMQDIVQNAVDTAGTGVVLRWNHVSQEVWCLLSQALPGDTDTKNRVVLTFNPANGAWSILDLPLSFFERVVDGTLGAKVWGCDYFGDILELDVLAGDGIQGNEAWIPATNTVSSFSTTAKTITKTGASFPATLRGVALVVKDVSTGEAERLTILSAATDTLTVDRIPSWLANSDLFYVGGIHSYVETLEHDGGRPTRKVATTLELQFADLTVGRY